MSLSVQKLLLTILSSFVILPVFAYEDCVIMTDGKLTDIKIQHNDVIDVFPLVTISNDKNTLIVHPLKTGETKFTVLKNNKDKFLFSVKADDEKTEINPVEGFEIFTVDCPPEAYEYSFDLDEPPETENSTDDISDELDEPPMLRGEE